MEACQSLLTSNVSPATNKGGAAAPADRDVLQLCASASPSRPNTTWPLCQLQPNCPPPTNEPDEVPTRPNELAGLAPPRPVAAGMSTEPDVLPHFPPRLPPT